MYPKSYPYKSCLLNLFAAVYKNKTETLKCLRIINEIHQPSLNGNSLKINIFKQLKQWQDNKWKQCLRPHWEPSYKSHFQPYLWIAIIRLKSRNQTYQMHEALKVVIHFEFFIPLLFFFLLVVVLLPFHFLYTPGVNYNCIETMVFWILCMYKTQWQSINNYCCKMQMKTLREDVSDQMDLAIMIVLFHCALECDAWTSKTRNVNAEWCANQTITTTTT